MEIKELQVVLVKAETTYGTDPVPTTAANAIPFLADSISWQVGSTPVQRRLADASLDRLAGFNAMPNVTFKGRYEVRGNRTDGVTADISQGVIGKAIEIDCLLLAANLFGVYTAESSGGARDGMVVYSPKVYTTVGPSVTLYWYTALKLHKLLGGKVNLERIGFEAGKIAYIDFSIQGKYVAVADATFPTTLTWLATVPPLFDATPTLNLGGYTPVVNSVVLELGNKIAMRKNASAVDSIEGFVITGYEPKGTFDPESITEASKSFWADWKANSVYNMLVGVGLGTTAGSGNRLTAQIQAEVKSINYADRDQTRIHQVQFNVVRGAVGSSYGSGFLLKWN